MESVTSCPPLEKKPLLPRVYPAFSRICLAAAALPVAETVMLATGALHALKVGSVRPVALRTGSSRPASPSEAMRVRLIAALMACRTGNWLVGHLFRFGIRLLVPPGASQ